MQLTDFAAHLDRCIKIEKFQFLLQRAIYAANFCKSHTAFNSDLLLNGQVIVSGNFAYFITDK